MLSPSRSFWKNHQNALGLATLTDGSRGRLGGLLQVPESADSVPVTPHFMNISAQLERIFPYYTLSPSSDFQILKK